MRVVLLALLAVTAPGQAHADLPEPISLGSTDRTLLEQRILSLSALARAGRDLPANTAEALADALRSIGLTHQRRFSTGIIVLRRLLEDTTTRLLLRSLGADALERIWHLALLAVGHAASGGQEIRTRLREICRGDVPWFAQPRTEGRARAWALHCIEARRHHEDAGYAPELVERINTGKDAAVREAAACALLDVAIPATAPQLDRIHLRASEDREIATRVLAAYALASRGRPSIGAEALRQRFGLQAAKPSRQRCCSTEQRSPPTLFMCH